MGSINCNSKWLNRTSFINKFLKMNKKVVHHKRNKYTSECLFSFFQERIIIMNISKLPMENNHVIIGYFRPTARPQGFYSFIHLGSQIKQYTSSISVIRKTAHSSDEQNHHTSAFQDCNLDNVNKCPFYQVRSSFPQSNRFH